MNKVLAKLYPNPNSALTYDNDWELLVAVILSAQCTDARVNSVTKKLFARYRTLRAYANATQKELEHRVYSTGFYRNKAKNIRASAQIIIKKYDGKVPHTMNELIQLPGVGRKTANVVLTTAFGVEEGIAVDTHVRRFAIRFDLTDHSDPIDIERDLMLIVPKHEWWAFNHRLVQYGQDICPARKHVCNTHPLTCVYPKAEEIWPKAR